MDRRSIIKILDDADKGGYAIPMFNYTDLWDMSAVLEAAINLSAPIMFATIPKTANALGIDVLGAVGSIQMDKMKGVLIHHLDHSNTAKLCKQAIDYGFPSVMIDASREPLTENISIVKEVTSYAHQKEVFVEAEIGRIKGRGYEGDFTGNDFLVVVEEAVELVKETGVDSLAIGIGTAHGFYKGKPEINFERLKQVNAAVDIPLVLHGGTGIPADDVRKAIKFGINKVNIGTQIRYTYMKNVRDEVSRRGADTHTVEIMTEVKKAIKTEVEKWIKICMADGKAQI